MAVTAEQFGRQMATLGRRMDRNVAESVGKAAQVLKTSVEAHLRPGTGGDMRLSGVGRRGARVAVRYDVQGRGDPTALLRMTGPAHLVERDTAAHVILPRALGRSQGRSAVARRAARQNLYDALFGAKTSIGAGTKPLAFADGRFAYSVRHPGSKGKHPFERGVTRAESAAQRILANACTKSLTEVFTA